MQIFTPLIEITKSQFHVFSKAIDPIFRIETALHVFFKILIPYSRFPIHVFSYDIDPVFKNQLPFHNCEEIDPICKIFRSHQTDF